MLKFDKNGELTRVLLDGSEEVFGSFNINGNEIVFQESDCGGSVLGKYTFKVDNDKLTFVLISDDCSDRENSLTGGPWARGKQ